MKRYQRLAFFLCLVLAGCSSTRIVPLARLDPAAEVGIVGYIKRDGREHAFKGKASTGPDSVYLRAAPWNASGDETVMGSDTSYAITDLSALKVRQFSPLKTLGLLVSPILIWLVVFSLGGFQGSNP